MADSVFLWWPGGLLSNWFFMIPRDSFMIVGLRNHVGYVTYFTVAGAIIAFGQAFRLARQRAETRMEELRCEIRERKQAEASLRESEERFRTLAEEMPHFVWETDATGEATYENARWYEYTGLTRQSTGHGGWFTVMHPDDVPRMAEAWAKAVKAGGEYDAQARFRRMRDGPIDGFALKAHLSAIRREPSYGGWGPVPIFTSSAKRKTSFGKARPISGR